jgi:hypothetical protein
MVTTRTRRTFRVSDAAGRTIGRYVDHSGADVVGVEGVSTVEAPTKGGRSSAPTTPPPGQQREQQGNGPTAAGVT